MKRTTSSILGFVLMVPLFVLALGTTKEFTRKHADFVFIGKIVSVEKQREANRSTLYFKAVMDVERQIKGFSTATNVVSFIFEAPDTNSQFKAVSRCPPFAQFTVGRRHIVAAEINWEVCRDGSYFVMSNDCVEEIVSVETNSYKNLQGNCRDSDWHQNFLTMKSANGNKYPSNAFSHKVRGDHGRPCDMRSKKAYKG